MTNNDDNLPQHIKDALKQIPAVTAIEQGLQKAKRDIVLHPDVYDEDALTQAMVKNGEDYQNSEHYKNECLAENFFNKASRLGPDLYEMKLYANTLLEVGYCKMLNPETEAFMLDIENEVKAIAEKIMQKRSSYDNF